MEIKKANNNPSDNMNDGLIEALTKFQREYPNTTSGDLQTFIMGARAGWMAAMKSMETDTYDKKIKYHEQINTITSTHS